MHKRYKKIDGVGTLFLILGIVFLFVFLVLNLFVSKEYIIPLASCSTYSLVYGSFIWIYTSCVGYNYTTSLCRCSYKCSKAFMNYCVYSTRFCRNCNLSLMQTSRNKIQDGTDWRLLAKLGYEIGLINEKEIR